MCIARLIYREIAMHRLCVVWCGVEEAQLKFIKVKIGAHASPPTPWLKRVLT